MLEKLLFDDKLYTNLFCRNTTQISVRQIVLCPGIKRCIARWKPTFNFNGLHDGVILQKIQFIIITSQRTWNPAFRRLKMLFPYNTSFGNYGPDASGNACEENTIEDITTTSNLMKIISAVTELLHYIGQIDISGQANRLPLYHS
jgi:hypothetical protein